MSFAGFSTEKIDKLQARMRVSGILERDLEEKFVRSSGPGGQNVNKTATCVYLHHRPTGIRIKYQKHRDQAANRYGARWLLINAMEQRRKRRTLQAVQEREKSRRQTRLRSRSAKEKMLVDKKIRGKKKEERRRISLRPEE